MDAKLLIDLNRAELRKAEVNGLTSVQTATLHAIFDHMERNVDIGQPQPNPIVLEKFRSDLAGSLAHQDHLNVRSLEVYKQVNAVGQSALKSIMLINGGAAVALLAFLGTLMSGHTAKGLVLPFASSMRDFLWGVFLSSVAFALTYLGQLFYSGNSSRHQSIGNALNLLTSLVGAIALLSFIWGANNAYSGFVAFAP